MNICSTMGVGRQSRRVCFGAKPDKGFLDKKISPYPEVVRGRERELTTRPRREQLVAGEQRGEQQKLAWKNSQGQSTPDTGQQKSEAAWDRVQRQWVKMSLIPVALWNFR